MGDYRKFLVLAEYNNIADASLTHVGQKIRVPEIEGVPFLTEKQDIKPEEARTPDLAPLDRKIKKEEEKPVDEEIKEELEETVDEEVEEEPEETVDKVEIYRDQGVEFFNQMKYQEAITEFNKVINANPDDAISLEYLARSHFQLAKGLFEKKDYLKAKKEFEVSLQYN